MSEDLSKLDLFIKIMRMTETDNDNMSLVALRKANAMLASEKWDWDRLLRGKVKVIQDPFNGVSAPPTPQAANVRAQPVTPRPAQTTNYQWNAPPRPAPPPPPPPRQPQYPTPPAGPLHFRRDSRDEWCIASHQIINSQIGQTVQVHKKDGTHDSKVLGIYVERSKTGHFLYKIAGATRWEKKYVDQKATIKDLF